jgi:hypothetical protein
MFIIHLPETFKVGDTHEATINGRKAQVTYTDVRTLTIGAADHRRILSRDTVVSDGKDNLVCFFCSDSESDTPITRHTA